MARTSLKQFLGRLYYFERIFWSRRIAGRFGFFKQPDFLIIGAQRGGTTALFNCLMQHPDVCPPLLKEVHYFDLNHTQSPAWYYAHFPLKLSGRSFLSGEASPYYLFHPDVPERVAHLLPDVKLIALLRNPVDRAYSNYNHAVGLGFERRAFAEAVTDEMERIRTHRRYTLATPIAHREQSYLARGLYAEQLERWWQFVPKERLLLIQSERHFQNLTDSLQQIADFLGLSPFRNVSDLDTRYNATHYSEPMSEAIREHLMVFFRPYNQRLFEESGLSIEGWS